jgi:C4-dicarboxylate-specific signal transduction histidine kinase
MGSAHALRHPFTASSIPNFGRVPLLVDSTHFDDKTEEDYTFSIESSNRKPVELEARARQWHCREMGLRPAHANCIATLELSAPTVHEITQPVAALLTNAQAALCFLAGLNPNLDEVRCALTRVLQLGNRLVEIVDRTRALVQRVAPRKDDFEINAAIQETISLSQEALVKNDVSVPTRFAQGLPLVRADRVQLQQVILNLLTNAVEAMSAVSEGTRELWVSTERTDSGEILVAVQDSGPGLDTENLARVFDAFYSTKPRGLGIGLSICRSIIETHRGRLWASRTEPHGATFQFTLPRVSLHIDAKRSVARLEGPLALTQL